MSTTDFFDDDLVKAETPRGTAARRSDSLDIKEAMSTGRSAGLADNERTLSRLSKHRDSVENQVATTLSQIEKLRQRQEDLEKDRKELETLRRKQDEYEASKRDMVERLNQSLLALENEEVRASQMAELYGTTRQTFRKMLSDIDHIDEASWSEGNVINELSKAQLLVDQVRVDCSKSLAKVEAVSREAHEEAGLGARGDYTVSPGSRPHTFGYWFKVGLAVSLPLLLAFIGAGAAIYFIIQSWPAS